MESFQSAVIGAFGAGGSGASEEPVGEKHSFNPQWSYVSTISRFNIIVCSRRGGKTEGAVRRAAMLVTRKPGARVLYVTLIRRNAKKLFFEPLRLFLLSLGCAVDHDGTDLVLRLANGSYVECSSCLDANDADKHRGDKWDLVVIDEAQSLRDEVISYLVDEVLLPSLGDRAGSLDLLGTPPPAGPVGYFYDVFSSGKFQRFGWTLFDNPHFPKGEIENLCDARGLTKDHPVYRREFLGEFVVDVESLVYEYDQARNCIPDGGLPTPDAPTWRYSMGLDLGFSDRDAIVVTGWRRDDPEHRLYEAWSWQKNHLDVDQLAVVFVEAYREWKPQVVIGDTGGHGAVKVLKSLSSRLGGIEMKPKPTSLLDSIALVNDDLRASRILLDRTGPVAHDMKMVTWSPGKKEVSDSYHSDIADAFRYAHWGARHFAAKPIPEQKSIEQLRYERSAWRKRVESDPWNRANRVWRPS